MTFQAYIDTVRAKTGRGPDELKAEAVKSGVYRPDMKAAELVTWLKKAHGLGQGHAMAIWAVWKSKGWVQAPKAKKK